MRAQDQLDAAARLARVRRSRTAGFHTGAAKFVVLTELFIALGLWWRGTRYAAVWVAVVFHLSIEGSASVQVFSLLAIAVLLVWAVPSTRDRVLRFDPSVARDRRLAAAGARARLARPLPRRARFRGSSSSTATGASFAGMPAVVFALSRLPLTAWFALPVLLLPEVRRARRVGSDARAVVAAGPT